MTRCAPFSAAWEWESNGFSTAPGPLATGINQGGIFTRVLPESQTPDIQFHVATLSADMAGGKVHDFSGFTLSVCQLRPRKHRFD